MPKPSPSIINREVKHQVMIESHKAHIANEFADRIKIMDDAMRHRFLRVDFPDTITERLARTETDRLNNLIANVKNDLRENYTQHYGTWRDNIVEFANYEVEWENRATQAAFGRKFNAPTRAQVRHSVLSAPLIVEGKNKGGIMRTFYADESSDFIDKVVSIIKGGYYQGQTNTQIVRQLLGTAKAHYKDGVWKDAAQSMMTLTRTCVQHAACQARREFYEANTDIIDKIQIVATLDGRTSPICQYLDGQIYNVGECPMPPYHYNCRSTTVPVISDPAFAFLEEGATRVARDENGETKIVDGKMTYYEWLKEQDPKFVESVIGKKRAELLLSDKISAEEFRKLQMDKNFRPMTLKEMKEKEPEMFERIDKINLDSGEKDSILKVERNFVPGAQLQETHQQQSDEVYKKLNDLESAAMARYTKGFSERLNPALHDGSWVKDPQMVEVVNNIDSAMAKFELKDNVSVIRGDWAHHWDGWNVGDVKPYKAYMSTTYDKQTVDDGFDKDYRVYVNIPQGTCGIFIGDNTDHFVYESEFLLGRGLNYRVLERGEGFIKLEVVND